ncbi:MAG: hypothetical protein JOZ54_21955 [Acidobacteria bacterium]|nr:hypothetical protein [Acidobacteriota bacterium]
MDLVTISSLGVPPNSMAVLASAAQGSTSDLATFLPAVAQILSFGQPLNDLPGWALESALTNAGCSDYADWELILSGFVNVTAATSAGLAYLKSLGFVEGNYRTLVLMFVANGSSQSLTIDTSSSDVFYSDFGDALLAPTSIDPGTVGAFLFASGSLTAGTEGAMMLTVGSTGVGLCLGWLDPHSGSNGCALGGFSLANAPVMNFWYQDDVIKCGGTTQTSLLGKVSTAAAITSASGPIVTMAVSVTDPPSS